MSAPPVIAKKSFHAGQVAVDVALNAVVGYGHGSIAIKARAEVTSDQARALAAQLIALADEADAKTATRKAREERRQKWRDREIAAGRMVVFGGQS